MADRYFVPSGGAGVWNATNTTNWSATSGGSGGASAPTTADNVIFDQPGTYTVTMGTSPSCLNITVTAGTVNFTTSGTTAISVTIAGSMSLLSDTTWNVSAGVSTTTFTSTSAGTTITTYGASFPCNVVFNGVGGEWSLGSAFNVGNNRTTTLTNGTLNLNGYDLTTPIFSSSNANTRSIAFGSNNIILAHTTAATTVLSMANATNFTWTGTGGFTADASITRTFTFGTTGGSSTNAPNLSLTGSGVAIATLTTGSYFNTLNFGTTAFTVASTSLNLNALTLSSGGTYTSLSVTMRGTGTITNNTKAIAALTINNGAGTATLSAALTCTTYTQTAGTIDFATFNLTCSGAVTYTAGTLSNIGTITCTTWTCGGTFTLTQGTITPSTSFVVTGGFNYNGGTLSAVATFTQTSGAVSFGKAYALTATGTYTLTAGTLTLNGFDLTTGIFSSSNTNARSIAFGSNNIILAHTTAGTVVLSMPTLTNFTCTGTGGFSASAAITRTYSVGNTNNAGIITNGPNLTLTGSGTAVQTLSTTSYFGKIDFGTTAFTVASTTIYLTSLTLSTGGTYTSFNPRFVATGTLTSNGKTLGGIQTNTVSGTTTISGTLNCSSYETVSGTTDFASNNLTCSSYAGFTDGSLINIATITTPSFVCYGGTFTFTQGTISTTNFTVQGTATFNYSGGTLVAVSGFTQTEGNVTFNNAYSLTATGTYTLTAGTLTLNGVNLTTGIFSSSGTGVRSIAFGSNNIILAHTTAATTVLAAGNAGNFTWSGTGGFVTDASITRTFTFGTTNGSSTNAPNLSFTGSGTAVQTFTTDSWFNTINFGSTSYTVNAGSNITLNFNTLSLASGINYNNVTVGMVGTGSLTTNGKTIAGLTINSSGTPVLADQVTFTTPGTSTVTLTAGTLDLNGFDITTGIFSSSNTNARSIAFGSNNIILAHTTASTSVLSMAIATGFTWTGTGGFVSDASLIRGFVFGSTGGSTTNAPNLTFTGSGTSTQYLNTDSWFKTLNFGTTACTIQNAVGSGPTSIQVNTLTLSSGGTYTSLRPIFTRTQTWTAQYSKQLLGLGVNADGVTLTLDGTQTFATQVSGEYQIQLTRGTLDLGGYDLTIGYFYSNGNNTRSIVFGSNNIILANTIAGSTNLSMTYLQNFSYTGTGGFVSDAAITRTFSCGTLDGTAWGYLAPTLTFTGSGSAVQTITTASCFGSLNFGTTAFTLVTTSLYVGSITLSSSATYTALTVITTKTGVITPNGKPLQALTISHQIANQTTTLAAALTWNTTTSVVNLTQGNLDLNGFDLTIGQFSSSNANTRSITFGSNNIILAHTTAGTTNLSMTTATGFTWTGTGGFTAAADITRTFTFGASSGGTSTNAPNLTFTGSGTAVQSISSTSYFNKLDFGTTAFNPGTTSINVNSITLSSGGTFTSLTIVAVGTGTIITNGKPISTFTVNCPAGTSTLGGALTADATTTGTLLAGTLDLAGYTLTVGIFSSSNANTRSIAFGSGNIVLTYTASQTTILGMSNATNFTWTGTGGFTTTPVTGGNAQTFTFGASSSSGTSSNAPNLTFNGSATSNPVLTSGSWFNKLDFGSTSPTTPTTTVNVNSVTLSSGGTFTNLSLTMRDTGTIIPNAKTIAALAINHSGTTTLSGALGCTTYTQTAGTIDFATNNLTCSSTATYTDGTLSNIGTITCTTWTCAGTFTLTSGTITPSTSFVVTGGFNYNGGTLSAVPTFTHTSGNVTFSKAYALTTTGTYTLTAGTLTLNGFDLTTGIFSSSGQVVRSIAFGTNNIIFVHPNSATTLLNMTTATNFTCSGTGGFSTDAGTLTRTYTFGIVGGSSSNAPNLVFTGSGTNPPSITAGSYFNKIDFGTTAFTIGSTTVNVNSLTLSTGGTYTSLTPTMVGTGTLNTNGKTIAALTINCPGGTTTFAGAVTVGTSAATTLSAGTLDLAGYNLTTGTFSSSTSNTRSIAFGTGNIVLGTTAGGATVISMADATGFTYTGTGGFTTAMSSTRTFSFGSTAGGSASNAPNLSLTSGASVPTITSGSWFKNLNFTGSTGTPPSANIYVDTLTLATGGTYTAIVPIFTRTQTWTAQFSKQLAGIGVKVSGGTLTLDGTQTYTNVSVCYVLEGTLDLGGANQTFGSINSNNTNTRAITFGSNNIILGTTTAGTTVINIPDATNFTYTGTGGFTTEMSLTRTFTFGTTGGSTSNAPNLSLTSGASIPTITSGSWFKALDFTGSTCTPATTTVNVDTLTLATGGTYTGLTPVFTRTQTWSPQFSKQLAGIGVSAGTLTLGNTQTYGAGSTLYVNGGTLNLNSTDQTFDYFVSTTTGSRTITGGGSISYGTSWTVTYGSGFTGTDYTINAYGLSFIGGGGSYGTLIQKNATLTITGSNNFVDIQASVADPITITYLAAAGGGGGGGGNIGGGGGGGGGAGGVLSANTQLLYGTLYSVTVGSGGAGGGGTTEGSQGSSSILSSILSSYTAVGGGGGGYRGVGGNGGSGGGGGGGTGSYAGGTGTAGQGNNGGSSSATSDNSGGGGGSGGVGIDATTGGAGAGGSGTVSSISGTSTTYAGGGGGGGAQGGGSGGSGGGGSGATSGTGTAGTTNTGGGGGGGGQGSSAGGQGGSGVVIIKYPTSLPAGTTTGSPTVTILDGYRIYKWTSSGSIIFYP